MKKAAEKSAGPSRMDRLKSAAKKAGSMVKAGVKKAGKKAVQTAGKVAGEYSAAKEKQKQKQWHVLRRKKHLVLPRLMMTAQVVNLINCWQIPEANLPAAVLLPLVVAGLHLVPQVPLAAVLPVENWWCSEKGWWSPQEGTEESSR